MNSGWESCEEHAISVFTEIIIKYIKNLGSQAKRLTEMTDRRETNIFDVIHALKVMDISLRKIENHIYESRRLNLNTPMLKTISQITQESGMIEESVLSIGNLQLSFPKKKKVLEVPTNFRKEDLQLGRKKDLIPNLKDISISNIEGLIKEPSKDLNDMDIKKLKSKQKRRLEMAFCDLNQSLSLEQEKDQGNQKSQLALPSSQGTSNINGNTASNKGKREMSMSNPFNLQPKKIHTLKMDEVSEMQFL